MAYPVPAIPADLNHKTATFLDMCVYGISKIEHSEAFMSHYAANSGCGCNGIMEHLGFTAEESKMFIQYMFPLHKIIEKRRKVISETISKNATPF